MKQWIFEATECNGLRQLATDPPPTNVYRRTMDVIIVNGVEVGINETPYLTTTKEDQNVPRHT
jgi:hypothetical protein